MSLSRDDVNRVAKLARVALTDMETDATLLQLNSILTLVDQMQKLSTYSIKPMSHPLDLIQILRADLVTESNLREQCMEIAPKAKDGLYIVPRVVE